jgi:hypothetical protein
MITNATPSSKRTTFAKKQVLYVDKYISVYDPKVLANILFWRVLQQYTTKTDRINSMNVLLTEIESQKNF